MKSGKLYIIWIEPKKLLKNTIKIQSNKVIKQNGRMNAKNSVISDPTSDRISLKSRDKYVASSNFSIYYT